jgi:uncharacterized protein (TIGR03083 family)
MSQRFIASVQSDTQIILELLDAHPMTQVQSCPGWTMTRLASHVGAVHRMAATVLEGRLLSRPDRALDGPPDGAAGLGRWIQDGVDRLAVVLAETPSAAPAWNFTSGPQTALFWPARMAHETGIHRIDAAMASHDHRSEIDGDLAIDGINEFLELFRNRVLAANLLADIGGSLHLHATDLEGEWMIRLRQGTLTVENGHGKGDAAVRGTASDLLLGLWGRLEYSDIARFECFGSTSVVEAWSALGAF